MARPRLLKPPRLRRGDVIGVCSPASPPETAEKISAGVRYLESLGYRVEVARHAFRRQGYLAGTDEQRAGDLHDLFRNRHVRAIISTRGGFGCQRILPLLDFAMLRRHPKIVVGYSDLTALHLALMARAGLPSVSGAMLTEIPGTFGRGGNLEEQFWRCLTSAHPPAPVPCTLRGGSAAGRLIGGNLSLVAALAGTPYMPAAADAILLLEEIDERPYRIDRMLQQMKHAGLVGPLAGVMLGAFTDCKPLEGKPSLPLRTILREAFGGKPVASGVRFGHIRRSLTLPVGVRVRIARGRLEFLEAAVA
jgi:muramoyltetrapeptide carboxypeptidase